MTVEITVLISAFTAVAGMILGLVSARRASRADLAKQSRETATIISEVLIPTVTITQPIMLIIEASTEFLYQKIIIFYLPFLNL